MVPVALLLLSFFVPWPLVRTLRCDLSTRVITMLGLWPTSLILLYYAEQHPAAAVLMAAFGFACLLAFIRDTGQRREGTAEDAPEGLVPGALLVSIILFVPLVYLAWSVDGWLRLGWHNLLQAEAIYSVFLNNANDYGFASHRLGYPYLGLLPLGVISRTFDVGPTRLLLAFNYLALFVWVHSIYSFLAEKRDSRAATRAVAILSAVFLSGVSMYVTSKLLFAAGLGDINIEFRASPVTTKFIQLDAMTWGIASLSMQYYLLTGQRWAAVSSHGILALLFGAQTILTYPLLGPCAILVAAVPALELNGRGKPVVTFARAFSPAALAALLGGLLLLYGADKGTSTVAVSTSIADIAVQFFNGAAVVAFIAILGVVGLFREPRAHQLRVTLLCASFALAFVTLRLPLDVQYKFLYGMLIVLLFHASAAVMTHYDRAVQFLGRPGPYVAAAVVIVAFVFYSLQLQQHVPPLRNRLFATMDNSWLIESASSLAIKSSLERMKVPLASTTLLTDAPQPLVPFLRVPLFFYAGRAQVGYSMNFDTLITRVKAYSLEEYERRRLISQRIFEMCEERALQSLLTDAPHETFLFALKTDSACTSIFVNSPQMRWVSRLAGGGEVFVHPADMVALSDR